MDFSTFWRLYDLLPIPPSLMRRILPILIPILNIRIPLAVYTASSGRSKLLVAGEEKWTSYLVDRFFEEEERERTCLGRWPLWKLKAQILKHGKEADMTIIRIDRLSARILGDEFLAIPEWIGTRLSLPVDFSELAQKHKSLTSNVRLMEKARLSVAEGDRTFRTYEKFYHGMYVPFIQMRHGKAAVIKDFYRLRKRFRNGGLLFLRREDRPVGALLYSCQGRRLVAVALGASPGEESWMRSGGHTALISTLIQLGNEKGFSEIDFGGCRPFLNDGLLAFKRHLGMEVCRRGSTYFELRVHWTELSETVQSFLFKNPLILDLNYGFVGLTAEPPAARLHEDTGNTPLSRPDGIEKIFVLTVNSNVAHSSKDREEKRVFLALNHRNSTSSARLKRVICR